MITHHAYGRATFKLFRKVQNDFDFLVRDIDRQPVILPGVLTFHVWDDGGQSLLSLPLAPVSTQRGHYRLSISATDTLAVRSGIYVWSVTNDNNAITKLLYTNKDYGSQGILEVTEGLLEPVDDPYVMTPDDLTPLGGNLYSSALPGSMRVSNDTGNHSAALFLNNFSGSLRIQASVDEQIPTDESSWVDVETKVFIEKTGTFSINFSGNFTYVKFIISNQPGFSKLIYRN